MEDFFGLSDALSDYDTARVAVLPCPFDGTSTWAKGADRGPEAFRKASAQIEILDLELGFRPGDHGIAGLPAVTFPGPDPEPAVRAIQEAAARAHADKKFVFGFGGEHTVTVGLTRAARERFGSFSVLQIDAHADLRDAYEGSPYNHACVMHRVAEDDPAATLVGVGIRAACEEELSYAEERGIHLHLAHRTHRRPGWIDEVLEQLRSPVYVTVDLDGLDPSVLPSTGTPMPGGLGWYDATELLRRVGATHRVIAADVTELKPDPVNHHSEFLAAQLVYKMIGYFLGPPRP